MGMLTDKCNMLHASSFTYTLLTHICCVLNGDSDHSPVTDILLTPPRGREGGFRRPVELWSRWRSEHCELWRRIGTGGSDLAHGKMHKLTHMHAYRNASRGNAAACQ